MKTSVDRLIRPSVAAVLTMALLFLAAVAPGLRAQQRDQAAVTADGRHVVLHADGTWEFLEPTRPFVDDRAALLSVADRTALDAYLASLEIRGLDARVVIVEGLEGRAIAELAAREFRSGDQQPALLVLLSRSDRHFLLFDNGSTRLSAPQLRRIEREEMAPRFRANRYAEGLRAGFEAALALMSLPEPSPAAP